MIYFWRILGGLLLFFAFVDVTCMGEFYRILLEHGHDYMALSVLSSGAVSGSFVFGHGMATILNGKWS